VKKTIDIVRRLHQARTKMFAAAAKKALHGHPVTEELALLKSYDQLIESSGAVRRATLLAAALVALFCFLAAGTVWAVRVPSTNVRLTIVTDAVTFRLAETWRWNGSWRLRDAPFRLDEMSELALPPEFSARSDLKGRAWLDVENGQVSLAAMEFRAHGTLALVRSAGSANYFVLSLHAPLRGQAQISGAPEISAGERPGVAVATNAPRLEIPAIASFYDSGRPSIPARINLGVKDKIVWRDMAIERLSFARESSVGDALPVFVSAITGGTVTLVDTGEKVTLREADQLYLEGATGTIQELEIGPDSLRLVFEGTVKKIALGATAAGENLTPTWLTYIYHQERLGFFWGAVVFLWGVLWSGRQLLFK